MASTYFIAVFEVQTLPRGNVFLRISGPDLRVGEVRTRVMRWGHKKPFLGNQGWQVAEAWIPLMAEGFEEARTEIKVVLPTSVTTYLEEGSNYVFSLEREGKVVLERPIRWAVSYGEATSRQVVEAPQFPAQDVPALTTRTSAQQEVTDEANWLVAVQLGTRESYKAFLTKFPQSRFVPEAEQALARLIAQSQYDSVAREDEVAWAAASKVNTRESYTNYLLSFPQGRYKASAISALDSIFPDQVLICTRWSSKTPYGVDTCVFLLTEQMRVRSDHDFISGFATDQATGTVLSISPCQSIKHLGLRLNDDDQSGVETIAVELPLVSDEIKYIAVSLSIDNRISAPIGLEAVDAELEVVDTIQGRILHTFSMKAGQFGIQATVIAVLQRLDATWSLVQCEDVFGGGIAAVCRRFGVTIQ